MDTILLCLALTIFHEARGEPAIGQKAVATVVLNRARIRDMDVCDVLLEKGQFSWNPSSYITKTRVRGKIVYQIIKSRLPVRSKGWKASLEAAKYVLQTENTMQNIEFFHAIYTKPRWNTRYRAVFRAGNHVFYARKEPILGRSVGKKT